MTPKEWCRANSKTLTDAAAAAKSIGYSKCSKAAMSLASDPLTGVIAAPALKRLFRGGAAKRTKPCRLMGRLTERGRERFNAAKAVYGHASDQTAVEYAIQLYIDNAAALADTSTTAQKDTTTAIYHDTGGFVNVPSDN